jgi:cytochrome c556
MGAVTGNKRFGAMTGAMLVLAAGAAVAAGLTGAEAAKDRQAHMKEMGKASKAMFDQLRSGAPDMAVIRASAAKIDEDAKALPTWFPPGSGPETGVKMEALPVVWTERAKFDDKAHDLQLAAARFDAVAQSGSPAEVMPAMKAVGDACKSCHETFRAKDKD